MNRKSIGIDDLARLLILKEIRNAKVDGLESQRDNARQEPSKPSYPKPISTSKRNPCFFASFSPCRSRSRRVHLWESTSKGHLRRRLEFELEVLKFEAMLSDGCITRVLSLHRPPVLSRQFFFFTDVRFSTVRPTIEILTPCGYVTNNHPAESSHSTRRPCLFGELQQFNTNTSTIQEMKTIQKKKRLHFHAW